MFAKFVFLHLVIPHHPFVFDADGNEIEISESQIKHVCEFFSPEYDADLPLPDNHQCITRDRNLFAGLQEVTDMVKEPCSLPDE